MCQPKDKGGRRCPAHQPASIGLKKFMSEQYGLMPEQIEHTFKGLRAQGGNRTAPTPEQYAHLIARSKMKLENSNLSDKVKRSVLRQLNKELDANGLPDGATFYALQKLQARSREQKAQMVQVIREVSSHRGINRNQAYQAFKEAYADDTNLYSSPFNQPLDGKTRAVAERLLDRTGTTPDGIALFSDEPRITRKPVTSAWMTSMGYDSDDGRLEIETLGRVYAYHNVPQETYDRAVQDHGVLGREVMHNKAYAYSSNRAANADAGGRYCEDCHRYKAVSGHVCNPSSPQAQHQGNSGKPKLKEVIDRIENQFKSPAVAPDNTAWTVPVSEREVVDFGDHDKGILIAGFSGWESAEPSGIARAVSEGKVAKFEVSGERMGAQGYGIVSVTMEAYMDTADGNVTFRRGEPACTCEDFKNRRWCEHLSSPHSPSGTEDSAHINENLKEAEDKIHRQINFASYLRSNKDDEGRVSLHANQALSDEYLGYRGVGTSIGPSLEAWAAMKQVLDEGETVHLEIDRLEWDNDNDWTIHTNGDVKFTITRTDDGGFSITSQMSCSLCEGQCQGHTAIENFVRRGLNGGFAQTPHHVAREVDYENMDPATRLKEISKSMKETWALNDEDVSEMSRFADPTGVDRSYGANLDKYVADVREAERKIKRGENPLPVMTEGVTNGACAPGTGRHFGIELEYVLGEPPEEMTKGLTRGSYGGWTNEDGDILDIEWEHYSATRESIAQALYDAGLSDLDYATEYHEYEGDRWHIEDDGSVAGEVVSPKLSDTPEHWAEVEKVLSIIKAHGGKTSKDVGGHVHMGLGRGEAAEVERRKVATTQIFSAYQDSIRRIQTDPVRKTHRDSYYCQPVAEDSAQTAIYSIRAGRGLFEDHETSLNLGHPGRIEFRGGDGSLDLAHIQAQVAVAASVVIAAEKGEVEGDKLRTSKIGSNAKKTKLITRGKKRPTTDDELIVSDIDFRRFSDDIMNYDYGRKVVSSIAAMVPWQETRHRT